MKKLHDYHQHNIAIDIDSLTNEELYVFKIGLDKNLKFGLTEDTINWNAFKCSVTPDLHLMIELVNKLLSPIPKSAKIELLDEFGYEYGDIMHMAVTKTLRCGFSASTLNKHWPGAIKEFKVQLGKEVPINRLRFPLFVEKKWDGIRCILEVTKDGVTFYTRRGRVIKYENLPMEWMKSFTNMKPGFYDGELIAGDGTPKTRTIISGKVNSGLTYPMDFTDVTFMVFDYLTPEEFNSRVSKRALDKRRNDIEHLDGVVKCSDARIVWTKEELQQYVSNAFKLGYEGIMAKDMYSYYQFRRDNSWAKFKETKTADLTIIGFTDGKGKYDGMIGALMCKGYVEDKTVHVNVSGLTDDERIPDKHFKIGDTIEVKYNSVIIDKNTGEASLFLPRFSIKRFDK